MAETPLLQIYVHNELHAWHHGDTSLFSRSASRVQHKASPPWRCWRLSASQSRSTPSKGPVCWMVMCALTVQSKHAKDMHSPQFECNLWIVGSPGVIFGQNRASKDRTNRLYPCATSSNLRMSTTHRTQFLLVSEIPLSEPLRDLSLIIQSIRLSPGYEENLTTWLGPPRRLGF